MSANIGKSMDMPFYGGGSSGELWSTFPATTDVDFAGFSALNVGNVEMTGALVFEDGSEQVRGFRDTTLWNVADIRISSISDNLGVLGLPALVWNALGTDALILNAEQVDRFTTLTPYDSSGSSLTSASDSLGSLGNIEGVATNFDMSALFFSFGASGQDNKALQKYTISTPGTISTGSLTASIDLTAYFDNSDTIGDVSRHPDGKHFLVCNNTSLKSLIIFIVLDEKDDFTSYTISTMDVSSLGTQPNTAAFSEDGQYIIFLDISSFTLFTIRLEVPFITPTSINLIGSYTISSEEATIPFSFDLHPLGNHIYVSNISPADKNVIDFGMPYFYETDVKLDGRALGKQGADVEVDLVNTDEGQITLGDGNYFELNDGDGIGQLDFIDNTGWVQGSKVILGLVSGMFVIHQSDNVPTGYGQIILQAGVTSVTAGSSFQKMTFVHNGVHWEEVSRTIGIT